MHLTGLPNETLFSIASYLPCQQDVYALVQTNRRLYHTLYDFLYEYNSRYYYGSALAFVTKQGNIGRVKMLLKGLKNTRTKSRFLPASRWSSQHFPEEQWEDELEWDSGDEDELPFTRDISAHPLKIAGYSVADIVQIQKAFLAAIEVNNQEIVTLLFEWGAQANFYRGNLRVDDPGTSRRRHHHAQDPPPLYLAVKCGHAELVKYLLEKGADPDRYRPSPLYRAVEDTRYNIVAILLNHGAPLSYASVLKLAVQRWDRTMLEFLFDHGAEAAVYGHRALRVAIRTRNQEMVEFLRTKGANLEQQHLEGSEESQDEWDQEDGDGMDGTVAYERSYIVCTLGWETPEQSEEEPGLDTDPA